MIWRVDRSRMPYWEREAATGKRPAAPWDHIQQI